MMRQSALIACLFCSGTALAEEAPRQAARHFVAADIFNLEAASEARISPGGAWVAYVRVSADIMSDRFRQSIWLVSSNGRDHRPIAQGTGRYRSPVWSPSGQTLAFVADEASGAELRIFYLDAQRTVTIARLPGGATNLTWAPDGRSLAFQAFVQEDGLAPASLPPKPEGAHWADPVRVIDRVVFRRDGEGLSRAGFTQIFVTPADGGAPRQVTHQPRNHNGQMTWSPDGRRILFSANAEEDWQHDPIESDIYALDVDTGALARLTRGDGPEAAPALSPDGRRLAYVGFEDRRQGFQTRRLYVADANGANARLLTASFDREIRNPQWAGNSAIYFLYEDEGLNKLGRIDADGGRVVTVLDNVSGVELGRPYTSGDFSVSNSGRFTATQGDSQRPADLVISTNDSARPLTDLNSDVLAGRSVPRAAHISTASSADGREIDAWIVRTPDFDPNRRYPLLLEIHGGPFAAYGPNFSAEVQLFAAAGYIVVYANPRGSTSYGEAFANLIHHNYPSQDYDDLISVVDAAIAREPVDPERLYVTGGSGGGVLTAWIVGSTNRFRAAMVQKPVINWTSWVLTADDNNFFAPYWFGEFPWEEGAQARY